ncbi:MAG: DUF523 domain-containing protein [Pseudomonadota bacterium]
MSGRILVSACLLGQPVRYDGGAKTLQNELLDQWQAEGRVVPLCPEVSAGFPTPRAPAEIAPGTSGADVWRGAGQIREDTGRDVTETFRRGAQIAVAHARKAGCRFALLIDGSPSCGSTFIYSGMFDGQKRVGQGVVAAALREDGVQVFAPSDIEALAQALTGETRNA